MTQFVKNTKYDSTVFAPTATLHIQNNFWICDVAVGTIKILILI